ncbi:MAG: hypothetical protein NZ843_02935 [Fimbriimonadales bacterium]|nr:hypothetical protein [Fimbriimonadales bacterium]
MRAVVLALSLIWLAASLFAQHPTVFFGARLHLQARADQRTTTLRWYDDTARHSVVFLQIYHEAGYAAYIAQRLQNLPTDRNRSALDEAYLEQVDGWRVGKFYAPFGAGLLLNESVVAVQSPARFAIGDLPMRVVYLYNGSKQQRGLYVRVGTARGGASVGVGRRLGIDPHAFALWELPERPRAPEGYETLYGVDYRLDFGAVRAQLEWLYSEGKRIQATHWFAMHLHARELPLQPELSAVYQTAAEQLSWRLALQQQAGGRLRLNLTVRGKAGTIQFVAFGLQGDL